MKHPGVWFVVPAAFLGVFFFFPVVTLLDVGLRGAEGVDPQAFGDVVTSSSTRRVALFTVGQALLSTLVTVIAALPAAWVLGRLQFRGRRLFAAALVVPFVLPTVVVGTAFLAVLGPDGPLASVARPLGYDLDWRRSLTAIVAAHVFFNYAVIARTVGVAWQALDPSREDVARTLGASSAQVWRSVTWPQLRPAIASAASIVFLFTFTSFGVIKILGGPRVATLEVEIHRLTTERLDLSTASALSVLQMVAVVAALALYRAAGNTASAGLGFRTGGRSGAGLHAPRGAERVAMVSVLAAVTVFLATPLVELVWRSFATPTGPGLVYYRALSTVRRGSTSFVPPVDAIENSVRFGLAAAVIATIVGALAAVGLHRSRGRARSMVEIALLLPLGASAVTVGLGFLLALDTPPLDLRTSPWLIPIAQAVLAVPFVIRTLTPALAAIPDRAREAAVTLGATPWQRWWHVDVALLRRPLMGAFAFAFAISLGEFGATVFIARADAPTVPVAIFRALSQPGAISVGMAMALSTILLVVTTLTMLVVDRVGDHRAGTF